MFTPALTELTSRDIEEEGVPASHSATSRSAIIINTSPQYNYDSLSLPDLPDLPLPSLLPDLPDLPAYIPEHLPD
ncbi:MAG: hypothetical protein K0U52_11775, partial [Gammaproteobacteria bacterium]|nr:hypothetical protein [Gammaproteobacteria bacterium]